MEGKRREVGWQSEWMGRETERDVSMALSTFILWLTGSAWTSVLSMLLELTGLHTHIHTQSHTDTHIHIVLTLQVHIHAQVSGYKQVYKSFSTYTDRTTNVLTHTPMHAPNAYSVQMRIKKYSELQNQVYAKHYCSVPRITSLCVALHPGSPCTSICY